VLAARELLPGRQVLRSAEARVGKSKYPVPREMGARWPLFTLYRSCDMHSALDVVSGVDGDTTLSHLYDKVCTPRLPFFGGVVCPWWSYAHSCKVCIASHTLQQRRRAPYSPGSGLVQA
jgi:hypothetical protein